MLLPIQADGLDRTSSVTPLDINSIPTVDRTEAHGENFIEFDVSRYLTPEDILKYSQLVGPAGEVSVLDIDKYSFSVDLYLLSQALGGDTPAVLHNIESNLDPLYQSYVLSCTSAELHDLDEQHLYKGMIGIKYFRRDDFNKMNYNLLDDMQVRLGEFFNTIKNKPSLYPGGMPELLTYALFLFPEHKTVLGFDSDTWFRDLLKSKIEFGREVIGQDPNLLNNLLLYRLAYPEDYLKLKFSQSEFDKLVSGDSVVNHGIEYYSEISRLDVYTHQLAKFAILAAPGFQVTNLAVYLYPHLDGNNGRSPTRTPQNLPIGKVF